MGCLAPVTIVILIAVFMLNISEHVIYDVNVQLFLFEHVVDIILTITNFYYCCAIVHVTW